MVLCSLGKGLTHEGVGGADEVVALRRVEDVVIVQVFGRRQGL
jgi:hypothetical protein